MRTQRHGLLLSIFGATVCALSLGAAVSAVATAQGRAPTFGDGFLFGRPSVTLSARGGFTKPTAASQVFDDASRFLTVDRRDFAGISIATDIAFRVAERLDLQFGTGLMVRTVDSESRDFIGTDDKPINQSTIFRRVPATAGLKFFLLPPGRSLGTLAWVPARWAPYVAAGVGAMYYSYKQDGEFVDFRTLDIERLALVSKGWAPAAYGSAGVDISVTPRVGLLTEARYDYARGKMNESFSAFDNIDLSGISATVGLNFRF